MTITFIDKNKSLVTKVRNALKYFPIPITVKEGDIFNETGVIVSASNSLFTMGGGLDAAIKARYPVECAKAQIKKKPQQIGNILFTITVGDDFKATRELVDGALAFAFNTKNHKQTGQHLLVSGLGTGIGGLDEDDFVWLLLKNLSISHGYGWGIKYTKKNGTDFRTGKILYKEGKTLEEPHAPKNDESCTTGLHLGKDFIGAGNYNIPERIFFCIYIKSDLCHEHTDKVRVSKLRVVAELPQWLGYGVNGKKMVTKLRKKVNISKLNPYQATKLPSVEAIKSTGLQFQVWDQVWDQVRAQVWAQVRAQVGDQVWDQVRAQVRAQVGDQVRAQVWDQVRAQVGDQVWDQVRAQVWDQVWDQVRAQVRDQVWDQVGDQVWDQVGATSYWSVNVHFDLGISHWFGNLLKLGIMVIFVKGKIKIFGKKGKYLGEYDESELRS